MRKSFEVRQGLTIGLAMGTALAALLAGTACSSGGGAGGSGATTSQTTGTGTGATTTTSTSGAGGACDNVDGNVCPGGGHPLPNPLEGTPKVTATILDLTEAPIVGQQEELCGLDRCFYGATTTTGAVTITAPQSEKQPALKFGDALTYVRLAVVLPQLDANFDTLNPGPFHTAKLPADGAPIKVGADATSGDVTLSIPAGASVIHKITDYDTCDKQLFRSVRIPVAQAKPVIGQITVDNQSPPTPANFALLYGVSPVGSTICPGAKITVTLPTGADAPGWAANDQVEFWIMNVDTAQEYAPYGGWAKMSDGVVSADGKTVSTIDGQGFIYLETFAIRKKS